MPICVRCNKDVGLLGRINYNSTTKRCGNCEREMDVRLRNFRQAFLQASQDGIVTAEEWAWLTTGASKDGVDLNEALAFVRGDAVNLLERTLAFAAADGAITDQEDNDVQRLRVALAIPENMARPILDRLAYLKTITNIRRGILPTVRSNVRLESDEICHLETDASYHKVNAKSVSLVSGRLVATNKKLHFLSPAGGAEIGYKSIKRIEQQASGVYLELSKKAGNGLYSVADPVFVEAIIDTLVRMVNRELIAFQADSASRHIPHDVKQAVWQRDQGKCVQCSATSYLEFDHIIPHSKGGASTVNNVQLLCRKCNLEKRDRI